MKNGRRGKFAPVREIVNVAILAACNELYVLPEAIFDTTLNRRGGNPTHRSVSRARAYAALAIRCLYEDATYKQIAIAVSASNPAVYVATLDYSARTEAMQWWDDKVFMKIVEITERAMIARKKMIKEAKEKETAA